MPSLFEKYNYEASFGETLDKKKIPVITIYDFTTKSLSRLDLKEVDKDIFNNAYPAAPIFD